MLPVTLIFLLGLSWLALRSASWTRKRELFSLFFFDQTFFYLAVIAVLPVIILVSIRRNSDYRDQDGSKVMSFLFGFVFWIVSYSQTGGSRTIFSQANGFAAMPSGLADWWTIPDLVRCPNNTDCDRLGRPPIYGHGWKLLVPLGNDRIALLFGALAAGFVCYSIASFFAKYDATFPSYVILLSPSFIFSLERGQSDLFAIAIIFVFMSLKNSNKVINFIFSLFMVSLKPFFAPVFFKQKTKFRNLILLAPIFLMTYFLSMSFNISNIVYARNATLYPPNYQIGIDQIPSIFVQLLKSEYMQNPLVWKGAESFKASMAIGLVAYFVLLCFTRKNYEKLMQQTFFEASRKIGNQTILVFSSIYLLIYLSGSQVYYKAWISFPILVILISELKMRENYRSPLYLLLVSFCFFGGIGVNIWPLRSIGTLILAIIAGHLVLDELRGRKNNVDVKKS